MCPFMLMFHSIMTFLYRFIVAYPIFSSIAIAQFILCLCCQGEENRDDEEEQDSNNDWNDDWHRDGHDGYWYNDWHHD